MSLHLTVGALAFAKGQNPLHDEWLREQLVVANKLLTAAGLPTHDEPEELPGDEVFFSWKSAVFPFLLFLDKAEDTLGRPFVHARQHMHVPIPFDEVLEPPPGSNFDFGGLGSSYRLFEECRTLIEALMITSGRWRRQKRLDRRVDEALALESAATRIPRSLPDDPAHTLECYTGWLLKAAEYSLQHGASVMIY